MGLCHLQLRAHLTLPWEESSPSSVLLLLRGVPPGCPSPVSSSLQQGLPPGCCPETF